MRLVRVEVAIEVIVAEGTPSEVVELTEKMLRSHPLIMEVHVLSHDTVYTYKEWNWMNDAYVMSSSSIAKLSYR